MNILFTPQHHQLPPVRVELEALITTHGSDEYGCCEFLPTKHVFTVNGEGEDSLTSLSTFLITLLISLTPSPPHTLLSPLPP